MSKELEKLMENAINIKKEIEVLQDNLKEINLELQQQIEQGSSMEHLGWKFQHRADGERKSLDQKALKEAHPTIFNEFVKTTITKGSLAIAKPKE